MHRIAITSLRGYQTRLTNISRLDISNIYSYIFVLFSNSKFQAYEYYQRPLSTISTSNNAFIIVLKAYLQKYGLESLISLQVLNKHKDKQLQKFVLSNNNSAIILDAKNIKIIESYQVIEYIVKIDKLEVIELKGKETYTSIIRQTYQVFTNRKLLLDKKSLINTLRANKVIN